MKLGIACGILVVLSSVAGCAKGEVGVHVQTARQDVPELPSYCASDYKVLATGSEAFFATTGAYPTDQTQLVDSGMLRTTTDLFEYSNVGGNYVLTGVGDCSGFEPC